MKEGGKPSMQTVNLCRQNRTNSMTRGEGGLKTQKSAWCHLWTVPFLPTTSLPLLQPTILSHITPLYNVTTPSLTFTTPPLHHTNLFNTSYNVTLPHHHFSSPFIPPPYLLPHSSIILTTSPHITISFHHSDTPSTTSEDSGTGWCQILKATEPSTLLMLVGHWVHSCDVRSCLR
jgi:hypothetical protein